jgi:hypothetical protein
MEVRPPARRRISGQSLVETVIALTILVMIVLGLIHISMLAVTRHVCNFAAFSAARASVYNGMGDLPRAQEAARSIMRLLPSGTQFLLAEPTRGAFRVQVNSPYGYPLTGPGGRVIVAAEAPMYAQPNIPEAGDNASR